MYNDSIMRVEQVQAIDMPEGYVTLVEGTQYNALNTLRRL